MQLCTYISEKNLGALIIAGALSRANTVFDDNYTPGISAAGYIVFIFLFVCSFVCLLVLPSRLSNLRQSFASKFLKWCISQQLHIRKHSYLDHSYPGGLAFTP